jgi:hypothetical protein
MIDFDLNGRKVAFDETTVQRLRAKAKAGAGSSSMLNDLAVILGRAHRHGDSGVAVTLSGLLRLSLSL